MTERVVICGHREWSQALFRRRLRQLPGEFHLVSRPEELTVERLAAIEPAFVFFLDWSWIVPKEIHGAYRCVAFHAAPLPRFRGGSPIQNQVVRGVLQTKLTAFLMDEGIDTGDILLQADLSLEGHLRDILRRMGDLAHDMIRQILAGAYTRTPQSGEVSAFKRRRPDESELRGPDFERPVRYLYDFIRMLEDPYPNAFVRLGTKRLVFKEAELDVTGNRLRAWVEVVEDEEEGNG